MFTIKLKAVVFSGGGMAAFKNDPLFIIFEKHFYESREKSLDEFFGIVVNDYLNYLKYSGAIIPRQKENLIIEELEDEVNELLSLYIGENKTINQFLSNVDDISERKNSTQRKYFELF